MVLGISHESFDTMTASHAYLQGIDVLIGHDASSCIARLDENDVRVDLFVIHACTNSRADTYVLSAFGFARRSTQRVYLVGTAFLRSAIDAAYCEYIESAIRMNR